jgi:hypothetical protein
LNRNETGKWSTTVRCRRCGAVADRQADGYTPPGWYNLTVSVPPEYSHQDRPFIRIGMFCSARCLADYIPQVIEQEKMLEGAYEVDRGTGAPQRQARGRPARG